MASVKQILRTEQEAEGPTLGSHRRFWSQERAGPEPRFRKPIRKLVGCGLKRWGCDPAKRPAGDLEIAETHSRGDQQVTGAGLGMQEQQALTESREKLSTRITLDAFYSQTAWAALLTDVPLEMSQLRPRGHSSPALL